MCLYHDGGSVYDALADGRIVRTEHVQVREQTFLGLLLPKLQEDRPPFEKVSDKHSNVGFPAGSWKENADSKEQESSAADQSLLTPGANVDALTHYPAVTSIFGASEEKLDIDEADSNFENAIGDAIRDCEVPYNLHSVRRVQYNNAATTNIFDEADTPKLLKVFKSASRDSLIGGANDELDVITTKKTWKGTRLAGIPSDATILSSGGILKIKRDAKNISMYNTCLAVRGNFQDEFDDYAALYALFAYVELVLLMFLVAAAKRYSISQLNVRGAFLHANRPDSDEVFIRLPCIGGISLADGRVHKWIESLYGFNEATKLWYRDLAIDFKKIGLKRSRFHDC